MLTPNQFLINALRAVLGKDPLYRHVEADMVEEVRRGKLEPKHDTDGVFRGGLPALSWHRKMQAAGRGISKGRIRPRYVFEREGL